MYYELQLKIIKILHDKYLYKVRRHVYNKIIEIMIQPYIFSDHKNKQLESENFGLYNFGLTKEELQNEIKKYQDENQKLKDIINSIKDLIV